MGKLRHFFGVALILAFLFWTGKASAQSGLAASGGDARNSVASVAFTFGQTVQAVFNSPRMANEGHQQAYLPDSSTRQATVRLNEAYADADFTITAAENNSAGVFTYRQVLKNADRFGGDSIIVLRLTVTATDTFRFDTAVCAAAFPLTFRGQLFASSDTVTLPLTDRNGNDSIVVLSVATSQATMGTDVVSGCDSIVWIDGLTYTSDNNSATHRLTNAAGCDSVVTLQLVLNHAVQSSVEAAVNGGQTYDDNGFMVPTVPASYVQTIFDTLHSVSLLTGCDSTVILTLTVRVSDSVFLDTSVCADAFPVTFRGRSFPSEGEQYATFSNQSGADSVVVYAVHALPVDATEDSREVCESLLWTDGNTYTTGGTASRTLINRYGCDSVVTLRLTVHADNAIATHARACRQYTWSRNNQTYTSDAVDAYSYTDIYGCTITDSLYLTIFTVDSADDYHYVCGEYRWHDSLYKFSTSDATFDTVGRDGCDSVVTLHLTIGTPAYSTDERTACDSLLWHGTVYRQSTTASFVAQAASGCDSTITLHLTLRSSSVNEIHVQGSESCTYLGQTYTESGDYFDTLVNAAGCDSVVHLSVVVAHGAPLPLIQAWRNRAVMLNHLPDGPEGSYVAYHEYRWYRNGNLIVSSSRDYFAYEDNSPLTGQFYVEVPTDASRRYWLRSNTIDFSQAKALAEVPTGVNLALSPNPVAMGATVYVSIASSDDAIASGSHLLVYDVAGRKVYDAQVQTSLHSFVADYTTGVYTVVYQVPYGEPVATKMIVK